MSKRKGVPKDLERSHGTENSQITKQWTDNEPDLSPTNEKKSVGQDFSTKANSLIYMWESQQATIWFL